MGRTEPGTIRLSQRQAQVVVLTAKSLSQATMCQLLKISKRTLNTHLSALRERVGSSAKPELTMLALSMGWIDNPYDDMAGSIVCDHPPNV